jgi:hypothetical protein
MNFTAGSAFLDVVMSHELVQMGLLTRCEHSGSAADRAGTVERGEYCLAYEGGPVSDTLHRLEKLSVSFERDDFIVAFHSSLLQSIGNTW